MKAFFALFFTAGSFVASAQRNIDVLHYRYEIELSDRTDSIYGMAAVTVKFLAETRELSLNLVSSQKNGKGMFADAATENGMLLESTSRDNLFRIMLPEKKKVGETATYLFAFRGIPADGLIISKNKFGKRTFFADNWPDRARHWIPCNDVPADKASVEFIITAPSQYQVVSNGIQIEETNLPGNKKLTHWKEDVPLPTKVMVIGVAEFAVQHTGFVNDCLPVSTWVFPENKTDGFYDFEGAKDILAWHQDYIGPYAYKKLANVQSRTMFGGMENAGAIFYYEDVVKGKRMEESLQSHEIVHQWFGNHATEKSYAHLWLSEGFATYLTHIYMESKYGTDSLNTRMKNDRETVLEFVRARKRPVVDSTSDFMQLLNANSYQKGGWVLHMLRRQLGDLVFHKSIRDYYAAFGGKNADTKDLQQIFETNSGKDLERFFQQWLYRPVNPKFEISWRMLPDKKNLEVTVSQLQEGEPFEFPLEIGLVYETKTTGIKTFHITKKAETFIVEAGTGLIDIKPDPGTSLLAEITVVTPYK